MRPSIVRHRLAAWLDPAAVFAALYRDSPQTFWLDSGADASTGMSFMGASASYVTASVGAGTVTQLPIATVTEGTIFDFLRERVTPTEESGFPLGWIGWFGYELHEQTMVPTASARRASVGEERRRSRHPDAALLDVDRLIAFDHAEHTVQLIALGDTWTPDLVGWRDDIRRALRDVHLLVREELTGARSPVPVNWRDSDDVYAAKIAACQTAIRDGEAYQLCLTNEASVEIHPHPLDVYLRLRGSSPSHHGSFLRIPGVSLLSASPETFLTVRTGTVETRPIKGTRPRGATEHLDDELRTELLTSPKERAENLMIVDLMRNDLGRIAALGSVTVPSLLAVETYAQVHQLVSTVRARLASGVHPIDAITACFPAGSMTGAPKSRAVELLAALEQRPRGPYSGAVGYVGVDGSVDLAMTIRTIVLDEQGATVGAGGGITALSNPIEEIAEVKLKAQVLLEALGVGMATAPAVAR